MSSVEYKIVPLTQYALHRIVKDEGRPERVFEVGTFPTINSAMRAVPPGERVRHDMRPGPDIITGGGCVLPTALTASTRLGG